MTKNKRSGFAFELAIVVIIIICIAIVTLIVMFYNAGNSEIPVEIPQELLSENTTVERKNRYVDTLENYRDKDDSTLSSEATTTEDTSNIIERGNQEGENSIYKAIDSIVAESSTN